MVSGPNSDTPSSYQNSKKDKEFKTINDSPAPER
jgi:hypothetical protein